MPISGVQGRDQFRNWPQPLGVFCEAYTYPTYPGYWGEDVSDVLKITKSGLLFGMRRPDPDDDSHEAASDTSGSDEIEYRPVGLRRTRLAGWPNAERI